MDDARLILYGRYGLREYDKPFTERDTRFWTIGMHVEWPLTEKIGLPLAIIMSGDWLTAGSRRSYKMIFPTTIIS